MERVVDRIGICVENAYEAQLVLRKVNEFYGGKKVKVNDWEKWGLEEVVHFSPHFVFCEQD